MTEPSLLAFHVEDLIQTANDEFELVYEDAESLKVRRLEEVEQDARQLERKLAAKGQLPNPRRLQDFFNGASRYARSCQKIDPTMMHVSWVWAPLTPLLEASSPYSEVINCFIKAFRELGKTLARADVPEDAMQKTEIQEILALIYCNVLETQRRLLDLVQQQGYEVFFKATWELLERRLSRIRQEIAKLVGLLRRDDSATHLPVIHEDREKWRAEFDEREKSDAAKHRNNVDAFMRSSEINQEDDLMRIAQQCHGNSCDWILENAKVVGWMKPGSDHNVIWLKGKPGCGKSVLSATIIRKLQDMSSVQVAYFICTETQHPSERLQPAKYVHLILRALVWQLVRQRPYLIATLQAEYCETGSLSAALLQSLLLRILKTYPAVRVVVDGLDEREPKEQEAIYALLSSLPASQSRAGSCKVLISSRDAADTPNKLRHRTVVDLSKEVSARKSIEAAIATFVRSELMQNSLLASTIDHPTMTGIEQTLLDKANGMFLWVHLVLTMLKHATTIGQMLEYLRNIPPELDAVYSRIFARVLPPDWQSLTDPSRRHPANQASHVFQLLTYSKRPMKSYEIRDAVTMCMDGISHIDDVNRVRDPVFDHCKPLVEPAADDTVRLIHLSVKDGYLLKDDSLFSEELAQGRITMSCIKYLSNAINLIDPRYAESQRIADVARGYHGLCFYACKHLIGHLLSYIELAHSSTQSEFRDLLLDFANSLAQLIQVYAPYQVSADHGDKIDRRCGLLRGRPELYSMVSSELVIFSDTNTRPRSNVTAPQGLGCIQRAYEDIARSLLQTENVSGVDKATQQMFRDIYSASVLVCRAKSCPRGLHGFATSKERDEHESTHRLDLRCPHEDCPMDNPSFSSPARRKAHLKKFHDDTSVRMPPPREPTGISRVDTQATLVEDSNDRDKLLEMISLPPWDEDSEEGDGDEASAAKAPHTFFESDQFALQTATR